MTHRNNIIPVDAVPVRSNRQKYHSGIPDLVMDMARKGMFPEEMCAELGVSMRTLYAWANDRPEFEEAMESAWHLLHAYWARLVRDNINNPAFRQTIAMQVMAKRFPATWGKEPRNTYDQFASRNESKKEAAQSTCTKCGDARRLSDEELKRRIEGLRQRRKVDGTSL